MAKIEFEASFGDDKKQVVVEQQEYGGNDWKVTLDGKLTASIYERMNDYYYHDEILYTDDVQAIVDRITEFNDEPWKQAQFYQFRTAKEYWRDIEKKVKP